MIESIVYIVLIPGILANVLHMILVKLNVFKVLSVPIYEDGFGKNKTYRGFLLVTLLTSLFSLLGSILVKEVTVLEGCGIGAVLGFTYTLFELPNSFLKRRLGIESGGQAQQNRFLFSIMDKTDSTFGVSLVYYLISDLSLQQGLLLFIGSVGLHVTFSFLLVALKIKKSF